jgi:hypothetical protein
LIGIDSEDQRPAAASESSQMNTPQDEARKWECQILCNTRRWAASCNSSDNQQWQTQGPGGGPVESRPELEQQAERQNEIKHERMAGGGLTHEEKKSTPRMVKPEAPKKIAAGEGLQGHSTSIRAEETGRWEIKNREWLPTAEEKEHKGNEQEK